MSQFDFAVLYYILNITQLLGQNQNHVKTCVVRQNAIRFELLYSGFVSCNI